MNLPVDTVARKIDFAAKILREEPTVSISDLQRRIKKKFKFKLSPRHIADVRTQVASERKIGNMAFAIKHAGERARLGTTRYQNSVKAQEDKSLAAVRNDLILEQQIRDLAGIIAKRMPGVKSFHFEINEKTGKPEVRYQVVTEVTGNVSI